LPKALSQKLLKQVQEQQAEFDHEGMQVLEKNLKQSIPDLETPNESDDDGEQEHDVYEAEVVNIDTSDEAALEMFMGGGKKTLDLASLIMAKNS